MLELDEYEMDGIAKLLHIAKRFADRGRLDLLLQASGKDAILSVETYLELEYDLPCLIFEDVTVQRHPEDDWRMFSERTVYIMRDSLLSRFDQLCREYEATRGILPIENPFVSTLEEAVNRALRMNSYSYDYCLYDSLRDKKGPKLVLIVDDEFEAYYDIPDALFSILDICKDGIDHLETELARLKREAEENKRKVIAFPKKKKRPQEKGGSLMEDRVSIHFSVEDGIIEVEQKKGPLISRKEISRDQLLNCFRKSVYIREDAPPVLSSGFLPLNTLAVRQTKESVSVVVWYPRLRADLSLYKTPYPDFPIPRLVFGFSVGAADGAVSACRIGVIADETPTPDTIMYHYPFSNVDSSGSLCIGANTLPKYKELRKAAGLPALLLSIPNNFDRFDPSDNQLGLDYRDLMQHLKDKEPAYYYTDILIPNGQTLAHFIQHM